MNPIKDCNKIFLQNTIHEVESHNRREVKIYRRFINPSFLYLIYNVYIHIRYI